MVQYFEYNAPVPLERGGELPALRIAYHTYGRMNAAGDNVVWVCHALTANSDVADWWPHTVEEGRFLDPTHYFVVCANILGSHYGTTGPLHVNPATGEPWYGDFPHFTIRDMVAAHRLLARELGIGRIAALVGSSVGGFQAVEVVIVEIFMEHAGGALRIVHGKHVLHFLFGNGGEGFGHEQPAVLGDALCNRLRTRNAFSPSRTDELHNSSCPKKLKTRENARLPFRARSKIIYKTLEPFGKPPGSAGGFSP